MNSISPVCAVLIDQTLLYVCFISFNAVSIAAARPCCDAMRYVIDKYSQIEQMLKKSERIR